MSKSELLNLSAPKRSTFDVCKSKETEVSANIIKEHLTYCAETGHLNWIAGQKSKSLVSTRAGTVFSTGYRLVCVQRVRYQCSRVAWLLHTGSWPDLLLDHINGDTDDNRIENLRQATRQQNSHNLRTRPGVSGVKGVVYSKRDKAWNARCKVNGKLYDIGFFKDPQLAEQAVRAFREKHHGEFAHHG